MFHCLQQKKVRSPHRNPKQRIPEELRELNYLDLDLDSDNSSPRTPKEGNGKVVPSHNNPVKDGEGVTAHHSSHKTSTVLALPKDTVYKTVDWNKTDALNKISRWDLIHDIVVYYFDISIVKVVTGYVVFVQWKTIWLQQYLTCLFYESNQQWRHNFSTNAS